ncbi:DNA repair protein RecN [Paucilactobacillus suebicus]|uniref:DNA repair protein RecN n=1 Tax=Paucilactobacillus suebicus DSM 5007 = KCTC 3549 TaxID=1423807 RepID=A0A0R1W6G8_9LACO|nr:DNA repair protein RecN [Paucilactobacillus suebicus]KRM13165.1 DNA repair protein RecN [Paucilactobacillus suebicus DSM 5007 = KCTC 3549]
MLQELTVDNLAIIDHLTLEFNNQMTVLTGETGAGKSIIIDAVGLLAGGRGSQEFIRRGEDKLSVQGQFSIPKSEAFIVLLDQLGIDHVDNTIIIQREIHRSGRNMIRVNGMLINAATLRKIGSWLVDIQGQNEHQRLLRPEEHLGMLDEYAKPQVSKLIDKYQQQYDEFVKIKSALGKKQSNEQQWAQRLDMLRFQVQEIEAADLKPNEDEELSTERDRLNHFQQINNALELTNATLNGDENGSILDAVANVMSALQEITEFDQQYANLTDSISNAFYGLQDAASEASNQLDSLEFDEKRLNEIENRLVLIADLEHKYGDSVDEILNYYQKIKQELKSMEIAEDDNDNLEEKLAQAEANLLKTGHLLTEKREKAAFKLSKDVDQQLKELYMSKAIFEVKFLNSHSDHILPNGLDQVEFYIQTNPGESLGPLAKIASGGELSRVMLALKTIFAQNMGITSIIFDEVDTGVSGRVAQAIAEKIRLIASSSQVLCITHLPQVAAVAAHHFLIKKSVHHNRTTTSVTPLTEKQRIDELARMLSGAEVTKLTLEHAQELLNMAQKK